MKSIYTRIAFLLLWIPAFLQGQNNLVIQQGTWTQSGAYVVIKNGNLITNGVFQQSAGTAKFSGSGMASIQGLMSPGFYNLEVMMPGSQVDVEEPITIANFLILNGGLLSLSDFDATLLTVGAIQQMLSSSFVSTNGMGSLVLPLAANAATNIPIGSGTTYQPLSIYNYSAIQTYRIKDVGALRQLGTTGTPLPTNGLGTSWEILPVGGGSPTIDLTMNWNGADELLGFNRNSASAILYAGFLWSKISPPGAASGSNPYTYQVSSVSNFGTFGVFNSMDPILSCQDFTVELDATGMGSITSSDVFLGTSEPCNVLDVILSQSNFNCAMVGPNAIIINVADDCGNSSSCTVTVTVSDTVGADVTCQDITVYLDGSGMASIGPNDLLVTSSDACGVDSSAISQNTFDCSHIGVVMDTLTVYDVNGNPSSCIAQVTVLDTVRPQATCKDTTIYLDDNGLAVINAQDLDNGSTDNCKVTDFSATITMFTCSDIGANMVQLTVSDTSRNSSTCTSMVTVLDTVAPVAVCQNITVYLDGSGMANITGSDLDGGTSDNCSVNSYVALRTAFDCADVGNNPMISLTVTDINGNSSLCTATVTVQDTTRPVIDCKDVTVAITDNGTDTSVTISQTDVFATPVSDNCSVLDVTLSQTYFTCPDVGWDTVVVEAFDTHGNSSHCTVVVAIDDPNNLCCDVPVITCPSDTVLVTAPFDCDVVASWPDPMVQSICSPLIDQITGLTPGSPFQIGQTLVTYVARNSPSQQDTCSFTVTILENGQGQNLQSTAKRAAAGLACHDHVNISLSSDCMREITARDVLVSGSAGCIDRYNCEVFTPNSLTPIPGSTLTYLHVGQQLTYVVEDVQSGGKCWGTLKLEDKLGPQILCTNDTISCLQMGEREDLIIITDLCQPYPTQTDVLEKQWTDLGCDDREFIGYLARKVRATDVWGNYKECRDTLFVRKETIDSLVCGPDTLIECTTEVVRNGKTVELLWNAGKDGDTYLDDQGYAHPWPTKGDGYFPAPYLKSMQPGQDPGYLLPNHTDTGPDFANSGKCQIVFDYDDHIVPTCGRSYKIRRTWHVYDWCGHRDTTCVQWFKFTDARAPVIDPGHLHNLDNLVSSEDQIHECDEVPQSVIQEAISKQAWLACEVLEAEVDPHDCKATVILPDPRAWVLKDCDDQLEVYYEIEYIDPGHPGKTLLESGTIPEGGTAHVYLPAGWHNVLYHIRDRCWNETLLLQGISVYDNTPPTPVCDEITQVSLDPEKCWARIYAKDLDDGSHDNCCQLLHFAVANMDSVTYWRNYWHEYFLDCVGHSDYYANQDRYDTFIEEWINTFVFDDYIDVTECGSEQLVLRVYEACGVPAYDPHTFYGGEHEWYWYNKSLSFQALYLWKLDEFINHGDPRYNFGCDEGSITLDLPLLVVGQFAEHGANDAVLTESGYLGCNISLSPSASSVELFFPELSKLHAPSPSAMCVWQILTPEAIADWKKRVFEPYRTEAEITKALNLTKIYYTPVRYNDCMIEVLKDDKTPPVVIAPEDVTVYCDGVPYWWELTKTYAGGSKTYTVKGHGAQFTHDVCEVEDVLQTYCSGPFFGGGGSDVAQDPVNGIACCVEIPWDGGDFGYYGGSVCGEYSYAGGVNCDEYNYWYESHNWQPIYCRLWLMLDKYDNPDGGHPNPQSYFDETAEDWVITDNCWAPETEVEYSGSLNECGVGTLTKTVTATDKCGNTAYDTQTLYVKPRSDFEVIFPEDVVVNCTDPGSLAADRTGAGYPEISDDDCELIGVTYSDERYDVTEGCYKILRTWKLIDWCVYSPDLHSRYPDVIVDDRLVASESRCCIHRNLKDDGDGYMTYLQVIKVVDDEAPVIVCNELEETCIYDNNCDAATARYELLASGTDNCAAEDEIQYRYTVLADETTPVAYGQGHELNAELAVGTYGVWLVGKDRCGNEDSCYTTFTIRDCKNPTPYCYHGIATVVMSPSGEVEVWATDFDAGSYDNCTTTDKLILSFTEDGETPNITFTCADIPDGRSQEIEVEIWVIDESGNKDFCTTTLLLQDNTGNACQDSSPLTESGSGVASPEQKVKGEGIKTPELYQNTPNPFSGETKIGFWLPESMTATLKVMDVTGKELYRVTGSYSGGSHLITLEAGNIPEIKGVLFYQLETERGVLNKRMVKVN